MHCTVPGGNHCLCTGRCQLNIHATALRLRACRQYLNGLQPTSIIEVPDSEFRKTLPLVPKRASMHAIIDFGSQTVYYRHRSTIQKLPSFVIEAKAISLSTVWPYSSGWIGTAMSTVYSHKAYPYLNANKKRLRLVCQDLLLLRHYTLHTRYYILPKKHQSHGLLTQHMHLRFRR